MQLLLIQYVFMIGDYAVAAILASTIGVTPWPQFV
jgi:hypothetical protein